ncbi:hypothetical protein Mp_2g17760 [Marchantia polymorpha subsp. ruderalis]|uniref:Uncharacterized protein n=1 Tax=Marchantia polymorpha TaxID=3197 RepID=A0A2R6WG91_MARPO|nr:hypothetical protein MARPO_0094s0044 [Marchantia polymorpha]BBN02744.1 hypothetical protein Mp_2g17760 [Marchantia polymorpha subsp. ruderalis]|eukprot:PTQ32870.1 hypothetical protein MARPO_0094s0044 [Marchantia polymorpha]
MVNADKSMTSIVLNGLPQSYKVIIQAIGALKKIHSFQNLISKRLIEVQRQEMRNQRFGEKDATLALQWQRAPMRRLYSWRTRRTVSSSS